jgi:cytochrome c-type biogenesis protein
MINVTVWLAFIVGFLSFISPCVLPLVPAYVGYMGNRVTAQVVTGLSAATIPGISVQVVQTRRFQMALHGIAFVAGFMFVFVVFGLAIAAGTRLLSSTFYEIQRVIIPHVGGILIVLFGLHFMGLIVPVLHWLECRPGLEYLGRPGIYIKRGLAWLQSALYADTRLNMRSHGRSGLLGSSLMGVIFAAGWTPCVGPIYGSILTMAASGGSVFQAGGLMIAYSLGLGIPFILTAIALDRAQVILRRLKRHLNWIKVASGVLMIIIGVLVYTGDLQRISQIGAANASFSYRLEQCTTDFFNGALPWSNIGQCLSGS